MAKIKATAPCWNGGNNFYRYSIAQFLRKILDTFGSKLDTFEEKLDKIVTILDTHNAESGINTMFFGFVKTSSNKEDY